MPTLADELRSRLERVVIDARDVAEVGARAALEALAVHYYEPYPHMKAAQRELRNHLRARARQLGDRRDGSGRIAIDHLLVECAYEHWHRMLFARFLAENDLLIEPDYNTAVSLTEAEELAKDEGVDVWVFASRCAQRMLPQIFRPDDPLLQVSFATEHMLKLEKLLASLPPAVFTASDALGWVYQFWQSKRKDEVNRSEVKIGADEISAVTQLFTEPYMVEFLLHNTLGAWWAGKRLSSEDTANAQSENELRAKLALPGIDWVYLRFVRGEGAPWYPAAGNFDRWPRTAAELRVLDPCCGSGHFLVAALHHLVPIRIAEEGLSAADAVAEVLRDNLHGLEIDERCCQMAAFALALAAWTYPKSGGYRQLPELHVACTGIGPQCSAEQWLELAEHSGVPAPHVGWEPIQNGLLHLHRLFSDARSLGSLIAPSELPGDLIAADYETIQPYLGSVLEGERTDDETRERAVAAAGMIKAAELLVLKYALVITNVPYLLRGKQTDTIQVACVSCCPKGAADLATVFMERCRRFCAHGGVHATVTPQNWLFLGSYEAFRREILETQTLLHVTRIGSGATAVASWDVLRCLAIIQAYPLGEHVVSGLEADASTDDARAEWLRYGTVLTSPRSRQLANPDARVSLSTSGTGPLLREYADSLQGTSTGDSSRFVAKFWELAACAPHWEYWQSTVKGTAPYDGREHVVFWEGGNGALAASSSSAIRGISARGQRGVSVTQMRMLPCTLFAGTLFDTNAATIIPIRSEHLPAIWAYCSSLVFNKEVRRIDQKIGVTNASLTKVPFDLVHWENAAAIKYPNGLPDPESENPTQWLFHGRPDKTQDGMELQVAVARLLGYRWPAELDVAMRLSKRARALVKKCGELATFADGDGIVCIPSVRGEEPAVERLLRLLVACEIEAGVDLDDWLRNTFFEEHCKLFHDRPFVWHIWDGRKRDGFHALVNYHKLAEGGGKGRRLLENLTYAYLGDWLTRQRDGVKRGEAGAVERLAAALELQKRLQALLAGEPPFDIFVRWKPLHEQSTGWEPDINDGVRMNIRPFLASDIPGGKKGAGILRCKPNIKWGKDRGKEPERPKTQYPWFWDWDEKTEDFMGGKTFDGNRWNDLHYTNGVKQAARDAANKGVNQ